MMKASSIQQTRENTVSEYYCGKYRKKKKDLMITEQMS